MLLDLTLIASAVVASMRMRCQGHITRGTSPVWSLHDLHNRGSKSGYITYLILTLLPALARIYDEHANDFYDKYNVKFEFIGNINYCTEVCLETIVCRRLQKKLVCETSFDIDVHVCGNRLPLLHVAMTIVFILD